jgi:exodeoxyribonuclease VII large subunit
VPLQTSPEQPAAVRTIARHLAAYIDRLGPVWIEGQVAQLARRPGAALVFLTLRDTEADMSLSVTCPARVLDAVSPPLAEGQRILVQAKAEFYPGRGSLSFRAIAIRPVGLGELLAALERLRSVLAAEGLFDQDRKRALPFLPRCVGLVCGRASDAERDVVENARRRWPGVRFEVREVAVQGPRAVPEVVAALTELDAQRDVQVIVVTRGGGSVEDLLPFSNEALVRAVAGCVTPVVSAIGHEKDCPLLDLVADVRASTPTDAARRVVPDVAEQVELLAQLRSRSARAVDGALLRAEHRLQELTSRPVLRDPLVMVASRADAVEALRSRATQSFAHRIERSADEVGHVLARVRALSPAATLARGYSVVQLADGTVVVDRAQVPLGTGIRVRLAHGRVAAVTVDTPV